MIYHGLFGMAFDETGMRFAPVVPENLQELSLSGVKYRDCLLKITVRGHGTKIARFALDGKPQAAPMLDATLRGPHEVEIQLTGN